jgi:hypothetical protein
MRTLSVFAVLACAAGCIRAPAIVVVDRATALEEQAAGSFDELEQRLVRSAIAPRPVPLTPDQLATLGIKAPSLIDDTEQTEADRMDALLRQHCIGEANDGTLADTHDACRGTEDRPAALVLIDRVNRARLQLWRWMHERRPGAQVDDLRRSWRKTHAEGVVCGGWMQRDDGGWEAKKC